MRGGLVDLEFIAQHLQLVHADKHPDVLDQNTQAAFRKLAAAGVISAADADRLIQAARLVHNLTQVVRLCIEERFRPRTRARGSQGPAGEGRRRAELPARLEGELRRALPASTSSFPTS